MALLGGVQYTTQPSILSSDSTCLTLGLLLGPLPLEVIQLDH